VHSAAHTQRRGISNREFALCIEVITAAALGRPVMASHVKAIREYTSPAQLHCSRRVARTQNGAQAAPPQRLACRARVHLDVLSDRRQVAPDL
jgi:hypothetical protein